MFKELIRQAGGSLVIRIAATALGFLVSVAIARLMGSSTLGIYSYAMVCVTLLATISNLGLNVLSVRELASDQESGRWARIKGLIRFSTLVTLLASLAVAVLLYALAPWVARFLEPEVAKVLPFIVVATPLFALIRLNQQFLRGLGYVLTSQVAVDLVRPVLFIVLLISIVAWGFKGNDAAVVLGSQWGALFITIIVGFFLLRSRVPRQCENVASDFHVNYWTGAGSTFLAIELVQLLNHRADILILGLFADSSSVGVYSVAQSVTGLATFPLLAGNLVMAPRVAQTYSRGMVGELNQLIGYGAGLVFLLSLPILIVCAVFTTPILSIWGESFGAGILPIRILVLGQFVNVFFANVALLLNMTGFERTVFVGTTLGVVVNIVLNCSLIPYYGMAGAAAATAVSMSIWNGYLAYKVVSHLNVDPSPLSLLSRAGLLKNYGSRAG